jgi:hypothetical protein
MNNLRMVRLYYPNYPVYNIRLWGWMGHEEQASYQHDTTFKTRNKTANKTAFHNLAIKMFNKILNNYGTDTRWKGITWKWE